MANKTSPKVIIVIILLIINFVLLFKILTGGVDIQLFTSKGMIALQERNLFIIITILMLLIVIPVYIFTYLTAWKYRSGNTKAHFAPDAKSNKFSEFIIWAIPSVIVLAMAIVTWGATHKLDPYKKLDSNVKPLTIQVVALRWKWLFIYPEENIATVNFIQFPTNTPINFELTADAPMNSFWIPKLGGQMYAMAGMVTPLHLIANEIGDYRGLSAEISGEGFAGMRFVARASSQEDFDTWVYSVKNSQNKLDMTEYNKLAKPSEDNPVVYYSLIDKNLYNSIVMRYMTSVKNMNHE